MNAILRSYYLEALGMPEFLHVQAKTQDLSAGKIDTQCLVVETNNAHSFCQSGKSQDFLLKMLGTIGLKKSDVQYVSINADDLNQILTQYNAKTVLLMSEDLQASSAQYFSMHHPSVIFANELLKRETWEVLKKIKACLA